ncbi:hypothetical protein RIF29_30636 [Crotalaria pallida]|uniref:NB-ARC domain-containing protein n=1 Tax=Crotalaria pallida TaxID=3830 RepID=A0AAN9EIH3_CROPI
MDDIWGKIDLIDVGVPFGAEHKGCKLLLASRDLHVLQRDMGTQNNFRLETLSEEEGWSLFEKAAGVVVKEYHIQPIALEVATACKGLPLLITTVAKALKNQDLHAWKDAFVQLTKYDHEGLPSVANQAIELSYKHLASDQHKSLFLLIGSHGNISVHVPDLLICAWGLDLFSNVELLAEAWNKLYKLIDDLKASSLILEGEREYVRMHDVIREGAGKIASRVQPFFRMQRNTELKEWPKENQLRNCKKNFLTWCYLPALPENLECPELEILVLNSNEKYLEIPNNFFSGMKGLKVLDLGRMMCTPSLCSSLGLLKNLKALYLCYCILEDITTISKLTSLEILSLENSEIQELPEEMDQLTRLRMLNLNHCTMLRIIPANLISRLTCLEELYMGNCYIQWEVEGSKQCNNASLGELRQLSQLNSLHLQIRDISKMPRDLVIFGKLEKYKILIGNDWKWTWGYFGYSETSRILKLNLGSTTITHFGHAIKMLLNGVEDLSLAEVTGVKSVLPEFNGEGFAQLKHLFIQNSAEIVYIIDFREWINPNHLFTNLESLVIHNLINLEKICCSQLPIYTFSKLQVIKVEGCEKLRFLFSFSMARNLPKLLKLEISLCKLMTNVIVEEQQEKVEDNAQINFPKIHSITLNNLPNLISFSSKKEIRDTESGSNIAIYRVTNPLTLFDAKVAMPNLETMKLSSINAVKLWDDISAPSYIQNLTHLTIDSCGSLKYLFSSSVILALFKLQYLHVTNCQMMEDIFILEGKFDNLQSRMKPVTCEEVKFSNLETLVVSHMDKLKSIYHDEVKSNPFPKLIKIEISFCQKLLSVFPSHVTNDLSNLETLVVRECAALEVVFETQGLYNASMELLKLQVLDIKKCGVESIVARSEMVKEDPRFVFARLTSLRFWNLRKLKSFYPGIHTLDCPSLKKFDVYHCNELEMFNSKAQNRQEVVRFHVQPLFSSMKDIPKIEELSLSSNDVISICNGEHYDDNLYVVKALSLRCFHDELDNFPIDFLQRFTYLEKLQVACSCFKHLEYLWEEKSEIQLILPNIKTMEVYSCSKLTNVVRFSSSQQFQNLDKFH